MRTEKDFTKEEIKAIQETEAEKETVKYLAWQYGTGIETIKKIRGKKKRGQSKNAEETEEQQTEEEPNKP